ncbi:dienelactone hydrolase family protein [Massilia sp. PWRC2]|uniref:dienelactone hydrolase family protein n=1 Tax=Massilia sp. PWRC2 TaxID=2804626 RepID=UPI003CF3A435
MAIKTEWIQLDAADGKFDAYVVTPHTGSGPGIVLIQEIFGVNEHIRTVAEQYAQDGFMVIVPDLFWRSEPRVELGYDESGWKRAVELMNATDNVKAQADISVAIDALKTRDGFTGPIAAIGYCWGGLMSYHTAANGLVDAAICYYGGGIQNSLDRASEIEVPVLMLFGEEDSHIPMDAVHTIAKAFEDNELVDIVSFTEAEHGFNCSHRDSYNQRAAVEAHGESLIFLSEMLQDQA